MRILRFCALGDTAGMKELTQNRRKAFGFGVAVAAVLALPVAAIANSELKYDPAGWKPEYLELIDQSGSYLAAGWQQNIILTPPPGHKDTLAEVDEIIRLKPLRADYQQEILAQRHDMVFTFFAALDLSIEDNPKTEFLLKTTLREVALVTMHFKHHYSRARPWQYTDEIAPTIKPPGHPAYPSGHSTESHTLAIILSDIYPEKQSLLLAVADQISLNREIAGVHYKSDSVAGEILAPQIVKSLKSNTDYMKILTEARTSLLN